jgi:SnoaL-like protein
MTDDAGTLAATYVDAWRKGDFGTLRSILADDVTFSGPFAHLTNADDCVEGLRAMSAIVTDIVVHKRLADDTDALTWFDLHTSVAPPVATANWSHVEGGKITRIHVTFDPRPLQRPASG